MAVCIKRYGIGSLSRVAESHCMNDCMSDVLIPTPLFFQAHDMVCQSSAFNASYLCLTLCHGSLIERLINLSTALTRAAAFASSSFCKAEYLGRVVGCCDSLSGSVFALITCHITQSHFLRQQVLYTLDILWSRESVRYLTALLSTSRNDRSLK